MKYYDITFHEVSGRAVIKRAVPSEKAPFAALYGKRRQFGDLNCYGKGGCSGEYMEDRRDGWSDR